MSAAVSLNEKRKGKKKDLRSGFCEEDEPPRDKVKNQGARASEQVNTCLAGCPVAKDAEFSGRTLDAVIFTESVTFGQYEVTGRLYLALLRIRIPYFSRRLLPSILHTM